MKQLLLLTCLALLVGSSGGARHPALMRTTDKGVAPFVQCFAEAQDRDSRPWSFVPKESGGGTLSDVGAAGTHAPYFVEVADRGQVREIRVTSADDTSVRRAVDRCI